jgi:HAD superfamily hydrolase (TIGR01509 family)
MSLDAVIFDLDGLLIDTEHHSEKAFHESVAAAGLADQGWLFQSLVGTTEDTHTARLAEELGDKTDPIAFRRDWVDRFHQSMNDEPPGLLTGVEDMLQWLQQHQIKRAVATSSRTPDGEKKLVDAGIRDYFGTVICGDQVARSKPHPDIYLKAGEAIGADMQRSLGLEDSANGVRAAHAAGLQVIQIPDRAPPTEDLLQLGHRVCDNMHDVLELIKAGDAII